MNDRKTKKRAEVPADAPAGPTVNCAFDELVPLEKLVPNPRNPNQHPAGQVALLAKVIAHQGWRSPIVVSKRSGFIVSGHGRYEAAKALGLSKVPVDYQDFPTDADEWAHLVADNRLAELAEADSAALEGDANQARERHPRPILPPMMGLMPILVTSLPPDRISLWDIGILTGAAACCSGKKNGNIENNHRWFEFESGI